MMGWEGMVGWTVERRTEGSLRERGERKERKKKKEEKIQTYK